MPDTPRPETAAREAAYELAALVRAFAVDPTPAAWDAVRQACERQGVHVAALSASPATPDMVRRLREFSEVCRGMRNAKSPIFESREFRDVQVARKALIAVADFIDDLLAASPATGEAPK